MADNTELNMLSRRGNDQKYTYLHLDTPRVPAGFRILEVFPSADFGSRICCGLHHVSLEDPPAYSAISYCWGKSVSKGRIHINDSYVLVTDNLEDVLRHLRQRHRSRMVWVDAICINQCNVDERNQQVRLMQRIFSKSKMTLIWLGNGRGLSDRCLDTVSEVLKLKRSTSVFACFYQETTTEKAQKRPESPLFDDPAFYDFKHLKYSEWFNRVWVVQELAVSSAPLVCLGNKSVRWELFYSAMAIADLLFKTSFPPSSKLWSMQHARERFYSRRKWRLLDMLMAYRDLEATDPRDKVYALLGLAHGTHYGLQQNYTHQVSEVYTDTALALMGVDQNLDILAVPRVHTTTSCIDMKLPSWVPDWSSGGDRPAMKIGSGHGAGLDTSGDQGYRFRASNQTGFNSFPDLNRRCLGINGHSLGCVQSISDCWTIHGAFSDTSFYILDLLSMGPKRVDQIGKWMAVAGLRWKSEYPLPESVCIPFWETTIMCDYNVVETSLERDYTYKSRLHSYHYHFLRLRWATQAWTWDFLTKAVRYFLHTKTKVPFISRLVTLMVSTYLGISKSTSEFEKNLNTTCFGRRLMQMDGNYVGLVPHNSEIGDHIFIVTGSTVPLVLRPHGDTWELVGEAYIHGAMYGECWDESKCGLVWLI